jgi:hypothetical protein
MDTEERRVYMNGTAEKQKQPNKSDYISIVLLYYSINRVFSKGVVVVRSV